MAQSKFKTGDRVYFSGDYINESDCGTVQPDDANPNLPPCYAWVLWDSDNQILCIPESRIEYEQVMENTTKQISVDECLDFLISKGYNVTLSKN